MKFISENETDISKGEFGSVKSNFYLNRFKWKVIEFFKYWQKQVGVQRARGSNPKSNLWNKNFSSDKVRWLIVIGDLFFSENLNLLNIWCYEIHMISVQIHKIIYPKYRNIYILWKHILYCVKTNEVVKLGFINRCWLLMYINNGAFI